MEIYPQLRPFKKFGYSYGLGLIELKRGYVELAKNRLEEMKTAFPDFPSNRKMIGWTTTDLNFFQAEIWLSEGFYQRAIAFLEEAPLQWPLAKNIGELLNYQTFFLKDVLARAYQQSGEIEKAIKEYERLITFDPERKDRYLVHSKYHYSLGKLYEEKGKKRKAI